jgi:glycosyltransferase involved in cell wall biosynthesis
MILNCFSKTGFPLVIVGNWKSNKYGRDLIEKFKKISNIKILDAIYDQEILNQIRSKAFIYIHGHSVGGTNPSLVEAMASGLPIFAYDVNFNRYTTDNSCLYFKNEKELISLILNFNKKIISKIGIKMKQVANQKYKWSKIGLQYLKLFQKL